MLETFLCNLSLTHGFHEATFAVDMQWSTAVSLKSEAFEMRIILAVLGVVSTKSHILFRLQLSKDMNV